MQPREMSVTMPVGQAMDRLKKVLFQPFDAGRWFVIGFCAWLAYLGKRGGLPGGFHYGGITATAGTASAMDGSRHAIM